MKIGIFIFYRLDRFPVLYLFSRPDLFQEKIFFGVLGAQPGGVTQQAAAVQLGDREMIGEMIRGQGVRKVNFDWGRGPDQRKWNSRGTSVVHSP